MLTFLARRTVAGRHIYAVGGNVDAAILSGVRVQRIQILTFALSGAAAGVAGAITVSPRRYRVGRRPATASRCRRSPPSSSAAPACMAARARCGARSPA